MYTKIVIPFKLDGAKSRLASHLAPGERRALALAMLGDVADAATAFGEITVLLRSGEEALEPLPCGPFDLVRCDLELNDSLNRFFDHWAGRGWPAPVLVIMADLALLRQEDVKGMLCTVGDVVLSPGRGGGTNAILVRSPAFRTCYGGYSFPRHRDQIGRLGLEMGVYASYHLGCDVDEPGDLAEVLIHGRGRSRELLEALGLTLSGDPGRASVHRVVEKAAKYEYPGKKAGTLPH